jgi:hypothetical protein
LNGRLFDASLTLDQVRGSTPDEVINCRCVMIPVDKWSLAERLANGERVEM